MAKLCLKMSHDDIITEQELFRMSFAALMTDALIRPFGMLVMDPILLLMSLFNDSELGSDCEVEDKGVEWQAQNILVPVHSNLVEGCTICPQYWLLLISELLATDEDGEGEHRVIAYWR
ncbi:hypothetical protein ARMGADRAFT_1039858 [Armillaria gallica]|uniref:Uncharacterized protein n=1 Tax=Armillaria gallica TaxID=47427 RepID=A0A2H3CH80_ARMGA|nr:hypothetical protein ARMGADRAFT_1039858 [Armillaria gallica]